MLSEVIVLQTHRAAVQDMFLMTATFVICARERCKEAEQSFRDANAMNKKLQKHERDISENPDTKEIKAQASQARDTKRFCFFLLRADVTIVVLLCKRPTVTALSKWCYVTTCRPLISNVL